MNLTLSFCLVLLMALLVGPCGNDEVVPIDIDDWEISEPRTLQNLQVAFRFRNIEEYARLLSDDFRFYPDPQTREREQLPEFWDRSTDSLLTGLLLKSEQLDGVKIKLTFNSTPRPVPGKPRWVKIDVLDTFLEVTLRPSEEFEEGVTLLVDGQVNQFYFRRGRTEGDTLSTSSTAGLIYIVEWHDRGAPAASNSRALETLEFTWSSLKSLFRPAEPGSEPLHH